MYPSNLVHLSVCLQVAIFNLFAKPSVRDVKVNKIDVWHVGYM